MRWLTPVFGAVIATSCLLPELTKVDSFDDDDGAGASGGEDVGLGGNGGGSAGASSSGRGGAMTSGGAVGTGGESGAGDSSGDGGSAGTSGAATGGRGGTATGGKGGTATGGKGGSTTGGGAGSGNTGGMGNAAGAGNTGGAGTGGSANGGTAGSGATTCGDNWDVTAGGYVFSPGVQTCWQGHAFTRYMGSALIAPTNFTACGSPCALCADGSVGIGGGYASLGFYLNQPVENPTPAPWTPVASGISLFFTNNAGSPMQLVLEDAGGQRWCYDLTGITHPVFARWTDFNTECIGGTGAPYTSQPVMSLQIMVPSIAANSTPFDFCIDRAQVGN